MAGTPLIDALLWSSAAKAPAGLTAAIALTEGGISTLLVGERQAKPDNRTSALLADSVTALDTLGVWPLLLHQGRAPQGHAHHR